MAELKPLSSNQDYYDKAYEHYTISESNNTLEVMQKWAGGPFHDNVVKKLVANLSTSRQVKPLHMLGVGSGGGKFVCLLLFLHL